MSDHSAGTMPTMLPAYIKNASDIINQVCQAVSEWPRIAKTCDVPQEMIDARFQYMLLDI